MEQASRLVVALVAPGLVHVVLFLVDLLAIIADLLRGRARLLILAQLLLRVLLLMLLLVYLVIRHCWVFLSCVRAREMKCSSEFTP